MNMAIAAIAASLTLASFAPIDDARLRREGEGPRRTQLNEAELARFDVSLLAHLTDWRHGERLQAADMDDKVVAIVFWNSAVPASVRAVVPTLKRLEASYGQSGLITLAVHTQEHWDEAQERIESGLISTRVAHDAEGVLAAALQADGAPDTYVIDRAGQLRFADLDERDVPSAIRGLVEETREEAASAGERRKQALAAQAEAERKQAERDERRAKTATPDEVLPEKPGPAQYSGALWPKANDKRNLSGAVDLQAKPLPVQLSNEVWLTEKPKTLEGRVMLFDFWATWCGPCLRAAPSLESLQKKFPQDLAVIAISGQREDEAKVRQFLKSKKPVYHFIHDDRQTLFRSFAPGGIPHVAIISSDGVVRWQGNPLEPKFQSIVTEIVNADPWVVARRQARE
jgi:thiol-disulfide isomerase/thioredoxin